MMRHVLAAVLFIGLVASAADVFAQPGDGASQTFYGSYSIAISGGPLGIVIRGSDSTQVVTVTSRDVDPKVNVTYDMHGGILTVKAVTDAGYAAPKDGAGTLAFVMPRYEFVNINNGSGSVAIDNLSTEQLSVATTSGSISIVNSNAALTASSTSGSQIYKGVLGAINAKSESGDIEVDDETGILTLTTSSGALTGSGIWLQGDATFTNGTGSTVISFQNGLGAFHFNLTSDTGALKVGDLNGTKSLSWGYGNIVITGTSTTGSQTYQ